MEENIYDLIVIGGGPAASAAAVYAGRKKLQTLLLTESFGGQSVVSASIENWIGEVSISGYDLAQKLEKHVRAQKSVVVKTGVRAVSVASLSDTCFSSVSWADVSSVADLKKTKCCGWQVSTVQGDAFRAKALLLATGARRKKLGVPGEEALNGKGVAYCSTCDAPFFKDRDVAVVGGGNAGLEAVLDLLPYATQVTLLNFGEALTGDPSTQEQVTASPQVKVIHNAETVAVDGEKTVTGVRYKDRGSGKEAQLAVSGVFVEIGSVPNSDFVRDAVRLNKHGEIMVDHKTLATSAPGIFAAGDVTDELYKQNNIAVGDAVAATLSAYNYLLNLKKQSSAASQ